MVRRRRARSLSSALIPTSTTATPDCAEPKCITCKAAAIHVRRDDAIVRVADPGPDAGPSASGTDYGWPTFSPDGKRIAYSSETHKQAEDSFAVWVYDLARSQATLIFESRSERIVYLVWLPDGQHLSFLLGEPRGLSLVLAEVKESTPVRIVTTGMPLYFAWGAGPDRVALHTLALDSDRTEQVSLLSLTPTSQNVVKVLSSGRTPFKTPAWSPDGKHLAYVVNYHAESNIVVADADATSSALRREPAGRREQLCVGARLGASGVRDGDHAAGSHL